MTVRLAAARLALLAGSLAVVMGQAGCGPDAVRGADPEVVEVMRRACQWQLANLSDHWTWRSGRKAPIESTSWIRSVFYAGVMATWKTTGDGAFLDATLDWAGSNEWKLGPRLRHPDDQCAGQTYVELYALDPEPDRIASLKRTLEAMLEEPRPGREDWSWCDALFMAPPGWARLSAVTQDARYRERMHEMWWDTTAFLYDEQEHLFYRDRRFVPPPDGEGRLHENGQKIFWSRGNGWVLAGTARVLDALPASDAYRARYLRLFQEMAATITRLQAEDGLWRVSLLAPELFPSPETSGSALFCYALAWGVNQGVLERDTTLPVVSRAWRALADHVDLTGRLGWVQLPGDLPRVVTQEDTMEFGVGALLLAGSEMALLDTGP